MWSVCAVLQKGVLCVCVCTKFRFVQLWKLLIRAALSFVSWVSETSTSYYCNISTVLKIGSKQHWTMIIFIKVRRGPDRSHAVHLFPRNASTSRYLTLCCHQLSISRIAWKPQESVFNRMHGATEHWSDCNSRHTSTPPVSAISECINRWWRHRYNLTMGFHI